MTTVGPGDLERLASDASLRALAEQESALRDLRVRAGLLLAANSIAVSLLGAGALRGGDLGLMAWLAVGAFITSLFATLYVLLPKEGFVFAIDGRRLHLYLWDVRDDPSEVHRRLAYWVARIAAGNQRALNSVDAGYRVATAAVVVQVPLWVAQLALTM
jgi:hypothetical protein